MTTSEQTNAALRCPTCGGNIVFDPEAQQFRCASCGSIQKVTPGKDTVEEYDFTEYREREGHRMLENGETALRCDVCGAEFFQPAEGTATVCPMCGSPQIKPEEEHNGIPVEGVVPFAIDRYEAQKRFGQWIRKRWFAPASLKRTFAEGELVGMYVPFWTYDADAVTQYCGRGGRTYTRRGRDGKTETYTQWYPVSGVVRGYYNDIQVCASKTASGNLIQKVLPYNTIGNTNPYHPQYLAGYQAECYTIDGIQGFKVAESYIDRDQRSRAESDIRGHGYSQAQVTGMNTHYDIVRYKQVLVPLWKARYGYAGKTYHYMINGENGKVSAQYPKSVGKIILVILLALAVFFGGLMLLESGYHSFPITVTATMITATLAVPVMTMAMIVVTITVDMTTVMILAVVGIAGTAVVMITATTAEILTTAATITATIGAATGKPPREREMNNGTF